ncbi:ABC transporter permease [Nesterenkonia salmonea]|uniref:ABC transporter permease n=1 Tax=Nesterenkonia salmonea TaxID=1804987 RepID=A0A5R9BB66_9MICC|nr:ABC transporter permease [Nesterenkonia salmonea]TLP97461.1 ABC transporter permease [Nesterenkonia salmonea]
MSTATVQEPTASSKTRLSTAAATRLVALREISTQVRSKSFIISTLITVVIIVGGIVATGFFGGGDDEDQIPVVTTGISQDAEQQVEQSGFSLTSADSMQEAEQLLRDGEVEAIITEDQDSPIGVHLIGLDEAPVSAAQQLSVTPTVEVLETDGADSMMRYFAALGFGLIFMFVAMGSGVMIMQNTIQEKQNRIVEILLSAIPARALLAGKILGNSVVALLQALIMGGSAALGLALSGQLAFLQMLSWPMLWFVLFFIPGFVLIASVFAASASLVSRQEDSGSVMTPAMMLVMVPYFVVLIFLDNEFAMTLTSYIPFTAPVSMSVRLFDDAAEWFEPIVSMGLLVLTTALVMALAAKIYSRSLLKMGQRVKLSAAFTSND